MEPGIGRVVSAHGDYYHLVCNEQPTGEILARKKSAFMRMKTVAPVNMKRKKISEERAELPPQPLTGDFVRFRYNAQGESMITKVLPLVLAISSLTGDGLDQLAPYLQPGQTVAFIGSTGVASRPCSIRSWARSGRGFRWCLTFRKRLRLSGGSRIDRRLFGTDGFLRFYAIMCGMERFFNIAGPCNPAKHYTLPALARLPDVASLIRKEQYFVVHAQRQCGKTTAFLALAKEINAGSERVAMYCSLEVVNAFPRAEVGIPMICDLIINAAAILPALAGKAELLASLRAMAKDNAASSGVRQILSSLAAALGKPLVVFFDEADCLSDETLLTFLRQLRDGAISLEKGVNFPASIALIGMRDIRDYKARIRPDSESLGSASPFNVLTKAMSLRTFTDEEVAALYAQHTAETGQVFETEAVAAACRYSGGQPYLVNALARWCVEEIHGERYGETVTAADMHEAKEKIIRERGTHLDSLMERMKEPRVRRVVEPVMTGEDIEADDLNDDIRLVLDLGILRSEDGSLVPANPMYSEIIGRYLSFNTQERMKRVVPETPWVKDDGLDMQGLLLAFQDFWRENAGMNKAPFEYNEAYPHIVLQAFLQRVINGGGEIIREMALGKGALDLGVLFRGGKYAVEVKLKYLYEKNPEKAYDQVCRYMDHLGVGESWLVVFDPKLGDWDAKLRHEDVVRGGKTVHVFFC